MKPKEYARAHDVTVKQQQHDAPCTHIRLYRLRSNECSTLLNYNVCKVCLPWRLHIIALVSHVYIPNSTFTALPQLCSPHSTYEAFFLVEFELWRRRKTNPPIPPFHDSLSPVRSLSSTHRLWESHHQIQSSQMLNTSMNMFNANAMNKKNNMLLVFLFFFFAFFLNYFFVRKIYGFIRRWNSPVNSHGRISIITLHEYPDRNPRLSLTSCMFCWAHSWVT